MSDAGATRRAGTIDQPSPVDAARSYAHAGFRVFPCRPDKKPCVRWTEAATTDVMTIDAWWAERPGAMIGLVTGDGLAVVDLDVDKETGAAIGEKTAERLNLHAAISTGLLARTPSGGLHAYFAGDAPTTTGRIGAGIDTRGAGGYIIAPGSWNPAGCYHWLGPGIADAELPELPGAIVAALSGRASGARIDCTGDFGIASLAEVAEMLSWIDPDAGGYRQWCDVLMGLHNHFDGSEAGLQLAEEWSRRGARYQPGEVARKWRSFTAGGGITLRTICEIARSNGADLSAIARRHKAPSARPITANRGEGPATSVPAWSEEALALEFARRHGQHLRYVSGWGRWMVWTGNVWETDETLGVFDHARRICREVAGTAGTSRAASIASAKTVAAVERLAKADRRIAATVDQWDSDPWILNTPDAVVDLRTGTSRSHRPQDYQTRITAVSPDGTCAVWLRFLSEITGGDTELQAFLQRMAGYALTGSTREHSLAFLHGTGSNGKSVFLNTLAGILGGYHKTAPIETFTVSNGGDRHPTELAGLRGARLVTAIETEEGRRWAESRIKSLTGGDPISARFMRQDFFEYTPRFKLVVAGNHRPGLRSVDEAIRRRFHLVPFTVTIPAERRDLTLGDRLRAEWPGILAWAIDGCLEWQEHGLAPPDCVLAATEHYLEGQDAISAWIDDACDCDAASWASRNELYGSWKAWSERNGEYVLPRARFFDALEGRGYAPHRRNTGQGYSGLRLRQHDYGDAHWNR